jgi:hypothetical protein
MHEVSSHHSGNGWVGLIQQYLAVGVKGVFTTKQYEGTVASHHRLPLHVKIAQHFIGVPSSDEVYNVSVDATTQEVHGTSCLQGVSTDVGPSEAVGGSKDQDGSFKGIGDISRFDGLEPRTGKKGCQGVSGGLYDDRSE